jgi:ABC-2 type transport system permease protein
MNRMMALIKREFWENKGAFRTTPIAIGGIYIVGLLMAVITTVYFDNEFHTLKDAIRFIAEQDTDLRSKILYEGALSSASLFTLALGFVVFFYLLGSLYDDRKDRSILFWKSLPASDTMTIASKLLSAMVVAPLIFWLVFVATMIVLSIIASVIVLMVGENPWTLFLGVSNPIKAWGLILASYLTHSIWALPLYGWLMLVSSFAPRIPLLFAVMPPVVFAVLQLWIDFLKTFTWKDSLFGIIGEWFANSPLILSGDSHENSGPGAALGIPITDTFDHAVTVGNMLDRIFSHQMLIGLVFTSVCLAGALWMRHRATDN